MKIQTDDQFVPASKRTFLIEDDILEMVPTYVEENPGVRIPLLHLDVDVYEPTKVALDHFYERVVPGGLIVLDEYAMMVWGKKSKAVEDFLDRETIPFPNLKI